MNTVNNYRLMSMPSAQCYVEIVKEWDEPNDMEIKAAPHRVTVTLISYTTRVCSIVIFPHDKPRLVCLASGTYSNTTARHINRFTTEFFGVNLYSTIRDITHAKPNDSFIIRGEKMWMCRATSDTTRIANAMQKVFDYTQNAKRFTGKYC